MGRKHGWHRSNRNCFFSESWKGNSSLQTILSDFIVFDRYPSVIGDFISGLKDLPGSQAKKLYVHFFRLQPIHIGNWSNLILLCVIDGGSSEARRRKIRTWECNKKQITTKLLHAVAAVRNWRMHQYFSWRSVNFCLSWIWRVQNMGTNLSGTRICSAVFILDLFWGLGCNNKVLNSNILRAFAKHYQ